MGKLILGIIAVVCLDLGFVAFMANDRSVESAKVVIGNAHQTDLETGALVAPASLSVYDEPQVIVTEPIVHERKVFVPVYVVRHVEVAARPYLSRPQPVVDRSIEAPRPVERNTFATHIIYPRRTGIIYPRPRINKERNEAAQRDLIYELATMRDRKPQKRSLVASAVVPVVKKPWDFIKAVGDKIK
jgi:hypothetical protein